MKIDRKSAGFGLLGLGLIGALTTGGVVAAQAYSGDAPTPQTYSTSVPSGTHQQFGGMAGMGESQGSHLAAAAEYLGLSVAELQDQLQAGTSLADVAAAQGKSVAGLEGALVAVIQDTINTNGTLTEQEKAAALEQAKSRIETMVNSTHSAGDGMGFPGDGMGMGHRASGGTGMDTDRDMDRGSGSDTDAD